MRDPRRRFGRFEIVLVVVGLAAMLAIYLFPAMNVVSIPVAAAAAAVAGLWIIGRSNDDPPEN